MKLFKKIKLAGLILTSSLLFSCSSMFDEGYEIESIDVTKVGGTTTVVITYTDEDTSPITFKIDDGIAGKDGVSIKNVDAKVNSDNSTTITITFSDSSITPVEFTIPAGEKGEKGDKGVSVTGVEISSDEENRCTVIVFTYSDGTKSSAISLPWGQDGKDGTTIENIYSTTNDDGTTTIVVVDSDGNENEFVIKTGGKTVNEVSGYTNSSTNKYVIEIYYEDGTYDTFEFDIPETNKRYYGESTPSQSLGKVGDYYLNTTNGNVYIKELEDGEAIWKFKFSMKGGDLESLNKYTLYFIIDSTNGEYYADNAINIPDTIEVSAGKNVIISQYDEPLKDGYEFIGWYTTKDDERSASEGHLTDLTPIVRSCYFYPHWEIDE